MALNHARLPIPPRRPGWEKPQYATSGSRLSLRVHGWHAWPVDRLSERTHRRNDVRRVVEVLLVAILMAVGLAGVLLPFMPGLPIIWGAALLYGFATEFGGLGVTAMIAITALAGMGIAASFVLPDRAGVASGATRSTRLFAGVMGVVGFFVIPVIGFPLFACAGVLLAQYRETAEWDVALRSTVAVLKGFGAGLVAELSAGLAMVVVWVAWVALD